MVQGLASPSTFTAPALSSSSHAMLASTAAATREKLNVGVSAAGSRGAETFPRRVSASPRLRVRVRDASPFRASPFRDASRVTSSTRNDAPAASMAPATAPARLSPPKRFEPGDGVSRSASAVRNRFAVAAASSSSVARRFAPVLPPPSPSAPRLLSAASRSGDARGESSMPSTRAARTTSASARSSPASRTTSAFARVSRIVPAPPTVDGFGDFGAGLAMASFTRIGTRRRGSRGGFA